MLAAGSIEGHQFAAVYGTRGAIEARDLHDDHVIWTVPSIPPEFCPPVRGLAERSRVDRVVLAPDGKYIVSYESPIGFDFLAQFSGGIVIRSARDGAVVAVYDVYGVTGLAIAPDSRTFAYSTGAGQLEVAHVAMPTGGGRSD